MLKVLSNSENEKAIKFLDETGHLLASEKTGMYCKMVFRKLRTW